MHRLQLADQPFVQLSKVCIAHSSSTAHCVYMRSEQEAMTHRRLGQPKRLLPFHAEQALAEQRHTCVLRPSNMCCCMQSALRAAHAREHSLSGEVFAVTQAKDNLQAALEAGAASEVKLRTRLREQKRRVVVAKSVQLQLKRQLRRERANAEVSRKTHPFMAGLI